MKNKMPPHAGVKQECFTLIELLVVIAVISLLAAMLLPALSKVKATAKRALCIGNTKNISLAYMMYVDSNDQYTVPYVAPTNDKRLLQLSDSGVYQLYWFQQLMLITKEDKPVKSYLIGHWNTPKWLKCPDTTCGLNNMVNNPGYYMNYPQRLMPTTKADAMNPAKYVSFNKYFRKITRYRTPKKTVMIFEGCEPAGDVKKLYIPGVGSYHAAFSGRSTRHLWNPWDSSGSKAAYNEAFNFCTAKTYNGSWNVSGDPRPISKTEYQMKLRKDFMLGRHGMKNVGIFFDGHVQVEKAYDWSRNFYVLFTSKKGWFWTDRP